MMKMNLQFFAHKKGAIKLMTTIANTYGYNSEGETFTICDPNEAWIMALCLLPSGSPTRQLSNIRTDLGIYILLHLPQSVLDSN